MNMNHALQNLYKAVSGSATGKVNISKLLCDIHYAITGVESPVKNNWSRIIDSMATNWPEGGGGGSSDFSTATFTIKNTGTYPYFVNLFTVTENGIELVGSSISDSVVFNVPMYQGKASFPFEFFLSGGVDYSTIVTTGGFSVDETGTEVVIVGDCSFTATGIR